MQHPNAAGCEVALRFLCGPLPTLSVPVITKGFQIPEALVVQVTVDTLFVNGLDKTLPALLWKGSGRAGKRR